MLDRGGGGYTQSKDRGNEEARRALLERIKEMKGSKPAEGEDEADEDA